MVGAEEEQQLKTGAPDSPSLWSLGQLTLLHTKKDGSNGTGERVCWCAPLKDEQVVVLGSTFSE